MGNIITKELYYNNINEIVQHQNDKIYIFLLKVRYKLIEYINNNNRKTDKNILINNLSDFFDI
jgi:hypothetical protein